MHQTRVEGMLDVLTPRHCRAASVPHLRGASLRSLHHHHARHAAQCDLERRDWHRAAEEGGGAVGEEEPVQVDRVSFRSLFTFVVFAVQPAKY